jgi:hypothetical protein
MHHWYLVTLTCMRLYSEMCLSLRGKMLGLLHYSLARNGGLPAYELLSIDLTVRICGKRRFYYHFVHKVNDA